MVDALLDTSIVIDVLRNHPPAITWLNTTLENLGVTWYTWLETIEGSPNKQKQQTAANILNRFTLEPITDQDAQWATQQLINLNLKYNIDKIDCLIAATSYRLQIPTYTRNLKHFTPLLQNLAVLPYSP